MCFYRGQKSKKKKNDKNDSFMPFFSKVGQVGVGKDAPTGVPPRAPLMPPLLTSNIF